MCIYISIKMLRRCYYFLPFSYAWGSSIEEQKITFHELILQYVQYISSKTKIDENVNQRDYISLIIRFLVGYLETEKKRFKDGFLGTSGDQCLML